MARALAHDRDERYHTAAELGRDLDRFLARAPEEVGAENLAAVMQRVFAAERADKDAILHGAGAIADDPEQLARGATPSGAITTASSPPVSPMKRSWLVAAAITVGVAIVGALAFSTERTAVVRIDTTPAGASVRLDGTSQAGVTPLLLEGVELGPHRLDLTRDGHHDLSVRFIARGDRVELHYALEEESRASDAAETVAASGGVDPVERDSRVESGHVESDGPTLGAHTSTTAPELPSGAGTRTASDQGRRTPPREPALLTLISRPWARVWINGEDAGTTPVYRRAVRPGRVRVELQRQGEGPRREMVLSTRPGQELSRNISLD